MLYFLLSPFALLAQPLFASLLPSVVHLKLLALRKKLAPCLRGQCDCACSPGGFVTNITYKFQILEQYVKLVEMQGK